MNIKKRWLIESGGAGKIELLYHLSKQKIALNAYASLLFMDDVFQTSLNKISVDLVEIKVHELGFNNSVMYEDITNAAAGFGLGICPLEAAVHFRLQFPDQAEDPLLTVSSPEHGREEYFPRGFYLQNYSGHLWLRGYRSTTDWLWDPECRFIFIGPNR